ncbi:NADH-quinone oxidoreductase subunit F [Candidatus Woesearchaeota archaeon]|nr:NADH-quinone oxidoreductase subunit F [Candidatus Woesearchaeota archaeon]
MQILRKTELRAFERAKALGPDKVLEELEKSGLLGRGGAGFPTARKWRMARDSAASEKFVICNADEGEPGTFKDRLIITKNPEIIIEGILIAAYTIDAKRCFIYLRGEYEYLREGLQAKIDEIKNITQTEISIEIVRGAGAYICGDETAILNSIQDMRGEPRIKPPYPVDKGLYDCPSCINNVETLANVPLIIEGGWEDKRLFSISGDVREPGVHELPVGITARELVEPCQPKERIKALFFGCAGGCIPYKEEMIISKDTVAEQGAMLGSCTIIAVGESRRIPDVCKNIQEFFVHESCGKCNPCREGNYAMLGLLDNISNNIGSDAPDDSISTVEELAGFIKKCSLCGLGQASSTHITTALQHFREEFTK